MKKTLIFISSFMVLVGCSTCSIVNKEPSPSHIGIERALELGKLRLFTFAKLNNIENLLKEPLISKAVVLSDKEAFDSKMRELSNLPDSYRIPRTFVAAPEENILWILPSGKIAEINPRDAEDPEFYQKLVAHELAHLLHVRYLNGDEKKMGPVWFYEGFAVVASDQYRNFKWPNFREELETVLSNKKRGDYQQYGYIWRELLKRVPLKQILEKSLEPDLNEWVIATVLKYEKDLNFGLQVSKVTEDSFVVTDKDFYNSNILVVKLADGTVVIVSSPFENLATKEMMRWIQKNLAPKQLIAINTHFHRDGTGGNTIYKQYGVDTWSSFLTKKLLEEANKSKSVQSASFFKDPEQRRKILNSPTFPAYHFFELKKGKIFTFGEENIEVFYPGPAHAKDNVVVYFPNQKILFGGCMIKPESLGYLGDANLPNWPNAARKLKKFDANLVIPGHGKWGGPELIDQTIRVAEAALRKKKTLK